MPGACNAALLVNGEIAAVITAMRQNVKWAPQRYGDEELEEPLLEELKLLRRKVFTWSDWGAVEPLEYLSPFLEVIKSPETSGPITAVALTAVNRFLERNILGHARTGVSEAVRVVAYSVTQCKFEATYPASDDCVLFKILDVLVSCVKCQWGRLLTDDNLISVFEACYRIGHYQTETPRDTSELLTEASRHAMVEIVNLIFSQLDQIPESLAATPLAAFCHRRLEVSPDLELELDDLEAAAAAAEAAGATTTEFSAQRPRDDGEEEQPAGEGSQQAQQAQQPLENGSMASGDGPAVAPDAAVAVGSEEGSAAGAEAAAADATAADAAPAAGPPAPVHHEIVSLLPSSVASQPLEGVGVEGYGIQAMREILRFIIKLVASSPRDVHTDLPAHGLDLFNVALLAAGPAFEQHESLLSLLQQDLIKAMFSAAKQPSLACLAGVCQVAVALYVHLGRRMLLQVEALIGLLLLPLAEGKGVTVVEQQQAALEGILDFCHQPTFVRDTYLNLDCRIERKNLFEEICGLLSKTAFPVNGPLTAVHLQSLDGVMAILTALSSECNGISNPDSGSVQQLRDPTHFVDIWAPLSAAQLLPAELLAGEGGAAIGGASCALAARMEKHLKGRLVDVAQIFNQNHKKGFQHLQSIHLLPRALEPDAVGRFLRYCPGLAKASIGEVLGERDMFYEQVRQAFIETFDFKDLEFDVALRLFMDAFRPPGEGQKIDRIMQVFGKRYHEQMPTERSGLKSADAAYVLAFSVIMLNTDLHNTQNKKKMSLGDFARINDNTNDGEPMPREMLTHIYQNIAREELKISAECAADELPGVFWTKLFHDSRTARGKMLMRAETDVALERDMFGIIWQPAVAAATVILENANESSVVRRALDALLLAAKMAAYYQVDDVVDQVVRTLSKFSAVLQSGSQKSVAAFGESEKARLALETMFAVANRYGDCLQLTGWGNVLQCILFLHKLGLLPAAVIAVDGEDPQEAQQRMPRLIKATKSSGGLWQRAITTLISIEGSDGALAEKAAAREAAATARATACVEACHIDEIFADSKFLTGESLVELIKATMQAAGNVPLAARTGENTDAAELCLELLITLALRNRDRVALLWPLLHEFLAACTAAETAERANPLVERAVLGVLRVCQRLLPYKEDTAEMLLRSLKLIIGLSSGVAWELADRIAAEMLSLLKTSAPYIRTEADWKAVCAIIRLTSVRPDVGPLAYESLAVVCREPRGLSHASYMPLLDTSLQFITRYKQQSPEVVVRYLDLIEAQTMWLVAQGDKLSALRESGDPAAAAGCVLSDEQMLDLWLDTVQVLTKLCTDDCQPLRDSAIGVLHRTMQVSDSLGLPSEIWVQTTRELIIPVVTELTRLGSPKARTHPGAEKSVRLAVNMLVKVLLQYMDLMLADKDFFALWQAGLGALQGCMSLKHEGVLESVPENVKNMLLVMATNGVLRPDWRDVNGESLWDLTFSRVHTISSGLNPQLLETAGVLAPPPPASPSAATSAPQPEAADPATPAMQQGAAAAAPFAAAPGSPGQPIHRATSGAAADAAAAAGRPPPLPMPPTAAGEGAPVLPPSRPGSARGSLQSEASAAALAAAAPIPVAAEEALIPRDCSVLDEAASAAASGANTARGELVSDVSAQDLVALRAAADGSATAGAAAGAAAAAAEGAEAGGAQKGGEQYSTEEEAQQASGCKQS